MVQAVATGAATGYYPAGAPAYAALQGQLQRYQQQLSDCVNCASADTPQGKADIESISARIVQVKGRMAQADGTQQLAPADQARPTPVTSRLGGRIDVFA